MRATEPGLRRFVHALVAGETGRLEEDVYRTASGVSASRASVLGLISDGAVNGRAGLCHANALTRGWLRRQMLDAEHYAGQHRETAAIGDTIVNLKESPLARLAAPGGAAPFLERHHLEAGERVRRLVERAGLQPRVTMTYSAERVAGTKRNTARDITDTAADARKALAEIDAVLPRDCAGVVFDVCGLLKGLQQVESERGWPRRSAKLVLRIGLDRLAEHFGYAARAVGPANHRPRRWLDEGARPERFE